MELDTRRPPIKNSILPAKLAILIVLIMTNSCSLNPNLSPSPTSEAVLLAGSKQLSRDIAFYKNLSWSPTGEYIAAQRCPVVSGEPKCVRFGEIIIIHVPSREVEFLDLSPITSERVTSTPYFWTKSDNRLLLHVSTRTEPDQEDSTSHVSQFYLYNPAEIMFEKISIPGTPFDINQDDTNLFILYGIDEEHLGIGLYHLDSGQIQEDLRMELSDLKDGPYVLSPNEKDLLIGDSSSYDDCNQISFYELGSNQLPSLFLDRACFPAWSPNGDKLAYSSISEIGDFRPVLMISDADGLNATPLFDDDLPMAMTNATWSPDATQIVFTYGFKQNSIFLTELSQEFIGK